MRGMAGIAALVVISLLVAQVTPGAGQTQAGVGPTSGPVTAPTTEPLDLEAIRVEHDVPAIAGLLWRDGEIVWQGAAGVVEAGKDEPVRPQHAWHIGSDTKAMTATLAARLVEQGKIRWDTTLGEALPELVDEMHESHRQVTLRQLLGHRGGVVGATGNPVILPKLWQVEEKMGNLPILKRRGKAGKIILQYRPTGAPGKQYEYSNYGYVLAGVMLEAAGGDSWENLMRREIFEPLEMTTAGFGPPPTIRGHIKADGRWVPQNRDNPPVLGPAGTVHCSLTDWVRFAAVHLGAVPDYLSDASLAMLHQPLPGEDASYALGWSVTVTDDGRTLLTHAGSNTMWFAIIVLDPARAEARLAAVNAPQGSAASALIQHLRRSAPTAP